MKIGDRVGAIRRINEKRVEFFGYGIYKGEYILKGERVPYVELDDGKGQIRTGCFIFTEESIKELMKNLRIVEV